MEGMCTKLLNVQTTGRLNRAGREGGFQKARWTGPGIAAHRGRNLTRGQTRAFRAPFAPPHLAPGSHLLKTCCWRMYLD